MGGEEQIKNLAEKVDNLGDKVERALIAMAGLPGKLFKDADARYAVKSIEKDVKEIIKVRDARNYDWLKFAIVTVVSVMISMFITNKSIAKTQTPTPPKDVKVEDLLSEEVWNEKFKTFIENNYGIIE